MGSRFPIEFRKPLPIFRVMSDQPKRRGRPTVLPRWFEKGAYPHIHTERQHQAQWYAHEAVDALGLLPGKGARPNWLVDWDAADHGKMGSYKVSVLEQLGRLVVDGYNLDDIRKLADQLCEHEPTTKDAVEWLRSVRRRAHRAALRFVRASLRCM